MVLKHYWNKCKLTGNIKSPTNKGQLFSPSTMGSDQFEPTIIEGSCFVDADVLSYSEEIFGHLNEEDEQNDDITLVYEPKSYIVSDEASSSPESVSLKPHKNLTRTRSNTLAGMCQNVSEHFKNITIRSSTSLENILHPSSSFTDSLNNYKNETAFSPRTPKYLSPNMNINKIKTGRSTSSLDFNNNQDNRRIKSGSFMSDPGTKINKTHSRKYSSSQSSDTSSLGEKTPVQRLFPKPHSDASKRRRHTFDVSTKEISTEIRKEKKRNHSMLVTKRKCILIESMV